MGENFKCNCNIGDSILRSKDSKKTIYFLGAKQLENNKWLVNFSFERVNYKVDYKVDLSESEYKEDRYDYGYGYSWGYGYGSSDIISLEVTPGEKINFASYFGIIKANNKGKEVKSGILNKKVDLVECTEKKFYRIKALIVNEIKSSYLDYSLDLESDTLAE